MMKKALVLILALVMALSLGTAALAAAPAPQEGDVTVEVTENTEAIYGFSVNWVDLAFTYAKGEWDTEYHIYTEGDWSDPGSFTVTNDSNAPVTVTAIYNENQNLEDEDQRAVRDAISVVVTTGESNQLAAYADNAVPTVTYTVTVTGDPANTEVSSFIPGTITVAIATVQEPAG